MDQGTEVRGSLLWMKLSLIHLSLRLFRSILVQFPDPLILGNDQPNLLTISPLDIIPLPSIGLRSSTSIFSTPAAIEAGRQGLESLNRELAEDPYNTSERLQKSLNELKELLKPEGITQL
jgi:hypothetical protein